MDKYEITTKTLKFSKIKFKENMKIWHNKIKTR